MTMMYKLSKIWLLPLSDLYCPFLTAVFTWVSLISMFLKHAKPIPACEPLHFVVSAAWNTRMDHYMALPLTSTLSWLK